VRAPGGGGSTAAPPLTIGPYLVIVFTDPAAPQSGAPLTLFAVVVGADGNPVVGKKLHATFSGPSSQAPLDAVEDPATFGPGRYKFDVAGLDPGTWKVTLAIGNEGTGAYSLVVSR